MARRCACIRIVAKSSLRSKLPGPISRSHLARALQPWARELLDLLGIRNLFQYEEIYPGDKTAHFRALREQSGVPFSEMLFFDDERRNIDAVSALGVTCVHVTRGLDWCAFEGGMKKAPTVSGGGS